MKKKLLFVVASLLTLSIQAQSFVIGNVKAQKSTVASNIQSPKNIKRALAANQYLCGYYNSDDLAQYGSGMGRYTSGACKVATEFGTDIYNNYIGFKVVGMRVGLCYNITDFGVFISKIDNNNIVAYKEKNVGTGTAGWNTVMFDESEQFELPTDGTTYIVGFNYNQKSGQTEDCYPISYYEGNSKKGIFLFYGNIPASVGGGGLGWYSLGNDGALSVQLIVEGQLSDQKIIVDGLKTDNFGKIGNEILGEISIINMGNTAVNSLDFNYYIDDTKVGDGTITKSIASTKTETVGLNIPVPADLALGQHTIKVEIAAIDGAAPSGEIVNNNITANFVAYAESVARQKQLIEHITSWTCTYCYLGYNLLRQMEQQYDDIAWVAIHGNQSAQQDPYYFAECDYLMNYLGVTSFPSASFNRTFLPELSEGESAITYTIGYYEQYISQLVPYIHELMVEYNSPSFVSLDIQSSFNTSSREMQVTVNGSGVSQAAQVLSGYGLTLYVTEAGLTGRQYSSGKWNNNFEHNNTLRAVLTDVKGDDITWDGDNFTATKSYTVPASYKENNLSIVAFVAPKPGDIYNMAVNNCEKVKLDLTPTAIGSINAASATETIRYTLDGRQISAPQHGINIVRMSDGTVRKVVVK